MPKKEKRDEFMDIIYRVSFTAGSIFLSVSLAMAGYIFSTFSSRLAEVETAAQTNLAARERYIPQIEQSTIDIRTIKQSVEVNAISLTRIQKDIEYLKKQLDAQ